MSLITFVKRRPHPVPLLQEREKRPQFLEIAAAGFTNDAIGYQRTWPKYPLPGGEDTGEGELFVDGAAPFLTKWQSFAF
jgi:hypothetical protein